jgi:hypothetical protein
VQFLGCKLLATLFALDRRGKASHDREKAQMVEAMQG